MTGKFRHKVNASKIKRRIPKGMSSESNPTSSRHRAAAHAARLIENTPMMAVDEVPVLDNSDADIVLQQLPLHSMSIGEMKEEDQKSQFELPRSMASEGGITRLSAFTNCTNPTFDRVHREWKSGSSLQKDVVAVLAAVSEVIKEANGEETDVEYFAALLTALEAAPSDQVAGLAATAFLLKLIVKKVSREVLQKYFSKTLQIIYSKLCEQSDSEDAAVLKNLLSVLGIVLRSQPASVWQQSSTKTVLVSVATFSIHEKAWVRTMSRRVLRAILTDPVSSHDNGVHPAAGPVGEFATLQLQKCSGNNVDPTMPTRMLCMVEGVMHKMPGSVFKQLAETILGFLSKTNAQLKCSACQCLYRTLQHQPSDTVLPIEINAQLILALRDFAPPSSDIAVTAYWMQALGEAHVCLTAKDSLKSVQLLPKTLEILISLFDVGNQGLAEILSSVLIRIAERCVQSHEGTATFCMDRLDKALNLQSAAVWRYVLRTDIKVFEECGKAIEKSVLSKALETLAKLRESSDHACKGDLDLAIGAAVRYIGVDVVLRALPLNIDSEVPTTVVDFTKSWLLPVLRVNICNAPLAIFLRFFLPLAVKLHKKASSLDLLSSKIYSTVQKQFWDLLPSFLNSPTDFEKSFPELAPILGAAIPERPDLRLTILSSIRSALRFALQPDAPRTRMELMQRFAKNYLPILFNLYTCDDDKASSWKGSHGATLETVRLYVELAPEDLINRYASSAIEKAHSSESSVAKKACVLDLLAALVKSAGLETLRRIFTAIYDWFATKEQQLQKKAFRILEEIFKRFGDASIKEFFSDFDDEIANIMMQDLSSIALSARAAYLAVLQIRLTNIENLNTLQSFCESVLRYVVLCMDKSHSIRARSNALQCLVDLCRRLVLLGAEKEQSPSAVLCPIFNTIYEMSTPKAGEGSGIVSLEVARSTMVALNVLAQKYVRILDASSISRMMAHACSWIGDGRPAVRVLVIRMLRIFAQKLPDYTLQQYKELLTSAIFDGQLTSDVTQKVRKANRLLLEVLVGRFGVEVLAKSTDKSDWLKQLKAIDKLRRRKQNKLAAVTSTSQNIDLEDEETSTVPTISAASARTAAADTILDMLEDSDKENSSSEFSSEDERRSKSGRSKAGSVWLKVDDDEEVLDLLDKNTVIEHVVTTKPFKPGKPSSKSETGKEDAFKLTKDGRLIISDLDELIKRGKKRRRDEDFFASSEDVSTGKKYKLRSENKDVESENELDESEDEELGKSKVGKYKAGGKGIHRDLTATSVSHSRNKSSKLRKGGGDAQKKGAKYEPYAYLPLRRKKGQTKKTLSNSIRMKRTSKRR